MDLIGDGFPTRGPAVFIVTTTTLAIASFFVAARLVSRFAILKARSWDDYFIILGWLIAFGLSFSIDYAASRGLGRHAADIPSAWYPCLRKAEYSFTILYNPALMATKTSILIFYLRMSKGTQKLLRIGSYVTLGIVVLHGLVLTFMNAFQCRPVRAAWDTITDGRCFSVLNLYIASAPVNVFTDLAILCLPLPVLTGIRLPQRQKTILVLTFGLGIFVTIVDIVRIYYLQQAFTESNTLQPSLFGIGEGTDYSWNASYALMWSAVEVNIGIICACIPTLKPLATRILPSIITDRVTKHSSPGTATQIPPSTVAPHHRLPSIVDPSVDKDIQICPATRVELDTEGQIGMLGFLTSPEMDPAMTKNEHLTSDACEDAVFFGFVNMKRPRSMLRATGAESLKYCVVVTILFCLWGFSYGLLNSLNMEIGRLAGHSTSQTLGLSTAYFGGYFLGPLTLGQWILRHHGFKATFISGLCIYGTGTLIFWPCAVLLSFPGFILSNLIVGFGLSILETAANPFIALCGPRATSEFRLLLAQGVQAVATVCSQAIAEKAFFDDVSSLIDVQWTYLAIALFDVVLALFFYYMPLPEASDNELQTQADLLIPITMDDKFRFPLPKVNVKLPIIYTTLALAVLSQFVYVSIQECMSFYFDPLLNSLSRPNVSSLALTPPNYLLLAHSLFAVSRFLAAFILRLLPDRLRPRILLLISFLLTLLISILVLALPSSLTGNEISTPALLFFFFEGPLFPLIFALGLRGLGSKTKLAAALLTAATSGGAVWPYVMWAAQTRDDHLSVQRSFAVVVALVAVGCVYPLYLNTAGRRVRGLVDHSGTEIESSGATIDRKRTRKLWSLGSILERQMGNETKKEQEDPGRSPAFEHRERKWSWASAGGKARQKGVFAGSE